MFNRIRSFFTMSSYFTQWRWHQLSTRRFAARMFAPTPLEARILLTTRTWTGGAILNDKWSDKDNWSGAVAPVANDDIVFPSGIDSLDRNTNQDITNASFRSIKFKSNDFRITGKLIKITGDLIAENATGINDIDTDITFTAAAHTITTASQLDLNGSLKNLTGGGAITKRGVGVLVFRGTTANTLSLPLLVVDGELQFLKSNGAAGYAGTSLTIGTGAGVDFAQQVPTVIISQDNALTNSPAVTINTTPSGLQRGEIIIGQAKTLRVGALKLNGGLIHGNGVINQGGILQLAGNVTVEGRGHNLTSLIQDGVINLGDASRNFTVLDGVKLDITSTIRQSSAFGTATQGLRKDGTGTLQLTSGNNFSGAPSVNLYNYSGVTTVAEGTLLADNLEGEFAANPPPVIPGNLVVGSSSSSVVAIFRSLNREVIANSSKVSIRGTGRVETSRRETIGVLEVSDNALVSVNNMPNGEVFKILGKTTVSGLGRIESFQNGNYVFADEVLVQGGTISLLSSQATFLKDLVLVGAKAEALSGGNLILQKGIRSQSSLNSSVIAGRMRFDNQVGIGRIEVANGPADSDLVINAAITEGTFVSPLVKVGIGKLVVNGNSTLQSRIDTTAGTLLMNGLASGSVLADGATATIGGNGSVQFIAVVGGILAPGTGPGQITVASDDPNFGGVNMNNSSKLQIELNGITPVTQHDQVKTESLNISFSSLGAPPSGPTLEVLVGFATALNQTFKIVDLTDPSKVTIGKFKDTAGNILNEGSTFIAGGVGFKISYIGGDGNDVTIKRVSTPPAFASRSITRVVREGGIATLSGLITEADSEDTFFLDVNWGDGITESFSFAPGAPRQIAVTHRYLDDGRPGHRNQRMNVQIVWRDDHGGFNTDQLWVVVRNN